MTTTGTARSGTVEEGHGRDALLAASADSPFIRHEVTDDLAQTWWRADGAVAFRRRRHRDGRIGYVLLGGDAGVHQLLAALPELRRTEPSEDSEPGDDDRRGAFGISLPQHLEQLLREDYDVVRGGDWEWFHTSVAPAARPGDETVVPLDDVARAAEVTRFLEAHSPTADTGPGGGERWFAIESESGRLAAVTACGRTATGAPHLSSVAVDTTLRGRGLGRRIVSVVTRMAVEEQGVCTLGMYSHNTVARALYLSLGYANPNAWASRLVTPKRGPGVPAD